MYFNPVTGAPATMPQIQLPQSQTAAIPVDGGFTVGDVLKKKRIAEALRAKVSQDYEQQAPTGHAAANGNFPGETYINYGNILQNAMQPWLEGRREKKAAAAEDEAMSARDEALSSSSFDPKTATVQQIQALQDLGVSGDAISAVMKRDTSAPKDNTGALSQLLQTRQGVTYAAMQGLIPPDSAPEYIAMIEQAEAAKAKGKGGTGGGSGGQSKTKVLGPMYAQLSMMDPNSEEAKALSAKIAGIESLDDTKKEGGAGGDGTVSLTPGERSDRAKKMSALDEQIRATESMLADAPQIDSILSNPDNFTLENKAHYELARDKDTGLTGLIKRSYGGMNLPPELAVLEQAFIDPALSDMARLGGSDTEEELRTIRSQFPNAMQSQEGAQALYARLKALKTKLLEHNKNLLEQYKSGSYYKVESSSIPEDLDAEMDALMGGS